MQGRLITVAAPAGGLNSGDGVVSGASFGVARKTAAAGEMVTIATEGVFDLPKLAIAAGRTASWDDVPRDDTATQVDVPDTGRNPIGAAIEAAGNGAPVVRLRFDGLATEGVEQALYRAQASRRDGVTMTRGIGDGLAVCSRFAPTLPITSRVRPPNDGAGRWRFTSRRGCNVGGSSAVGSATIQGRLWSARAEDWAAYVEQTSLPLHAAALDAARVTSGTRLLDAGCGAGLLALLASLRGARVSGLDASPGLLAIARERLPSADLREGDLEALPFDDASFDAVVAVNSVFYAADMAQAMRELARVARPGARVVVTAWGPPEKCAFLRAVMPRLAPLMPPPPPTAPPPRRLAEPGALAATLKEAGLDVVEEGEVACPFVFASAEASWRGNASAGVNQVAIAHSGEAAVRAVYAETDRAHTRPDGSVRYDNVFIWAAGRRP